MFMIVLKQNFNTYGLKRNLVFDAYIVAHIYIAIVQQ